MTPDPLAVHSPGSADLNLYAYVHGAVLVAIDPLGLAGNDQGQGGATGNSAPATEQEGAKNSENQLERGPSAMSNETLAVGALGLACGATGGIACGAAFVVGAATQTQSDASRSGSDITPGDQATAKLSGALLGASGFRTRASPASLAKEVATLETQVQRSMAELEATSPAAAEALSKTHAAQMAEELRSLCPGGVCRGPGMCFVAGTLVTTEQGQIPIEKIELGDRVEAGNTACADEHIPPDAVTIYLTLPNPGAPWEQIQVTLVRPLSWLSEVGLANGPRWVEMDDVGVSGYATVREVGPAPREQAGAGCLVLSTIRNVASRVLRLRLAGAEKSETLELTPMHRLSVEGQGWTRAGTLRRGDLLHADAGVLEVRDIEEAAPNQAVYNFEVGVEHAYRVGDSGVWAHNTDCLGAAGETKPLAEQAAELVPQNGGRSRVTLDSPSQRMEVDLTGKPHAGVPTPHTKVSPRNTQAPEHLQPAYNTRKAETVPATQQDIRTVRRYLERQGN